MIVFPHTPHSMNRPGAINWQAAAMAANPAPALELANTITHPTGPEYSFSVGEGTYTLREDILLATPPPHLSELSTQNPNPLTTVPTPPTAGTTVSPIVIKDRTNNLFPHHKPSSASQTDSTSQLSGDTEQDGSEHGKGGSSSAKRKKPKNNIGKSNSSFVSRIVTHDHMNKRLHERDPEGMFIFANINRVFQWLDMSAPNKSEPLSKIFFTRAHPLCHDVNHVTKSSTYLDVIAGFSTGDITWLDPMSSKYARINKNGCINPTPVYDIHWLPHSESLFIAAHGDGSLILYDKEKDDPTPEDLKAAQSPPETLSKKAAKQQVKTNPVARWQLSKQAIRQFAFSPDNRHMAVVGEDGCLRVLRITRSGHGIPSHEVLDTYASYYGEFLCVCFSPDGRYILTGGQDDLVSIWGMAERRIIARCQGHHSWVTGVAFDPWRCRNGVYRFGSVGGDCRLLLWDFSVGMLHRPKATTHASKPSISTSQQPTTRPRHNTLDTTASASRLRSDSALTEAAADDPSSSAAAAPGGTTCHPVESRTRTAMLPPIMSKAVDVHPLAGIVFREDSVIITCAEGHIRTWDRPVRKEGMASMVTLNEGR